MTGRGAALLLVGVALSACSGDREGPTAPADPLPLRAGTYVVYVAGDTFLCNDAALPQSGTVAQALASATMSGSEWILRPASLSGGDFEITLIEGVLATTPTYLAVTGTIRGQIVDSFSVTVAPSGRRASFQSIQINGEVPRTGTPIEGRFNGQVIFSRDNLVSVCPPGAVAFRMSWFSE